MAADIKEAERLARESTERALSDAHRRHTAELRKQVSRCDEAVHEINDRLGEDRRRSLAEIDRQITAFRRLSEDAGREIKGTAGVLLETRNERWMRDYTKETEAEVAKLRELKAALRDEVLLERAHAQRAGRTDNGDAADSSIATKVVRFAAEVIVNHIVPGFGSILVNAGECALKLTGVLGNPSREEGVEVSLPVTIVPGLVNLNIGMRLYEDPWVHKECPITLSLQPDIGYNFPSVDILEGSDSPKDREPHPEEPWERDDIELESASDEQRESAPANSLTRPLSIEPMAPTAPPYDIESMPAGGPAGARPNNGFRSVMVVEEARSRPKEPELQAASLEAKGLGHERPNATDANADDPAERSWVTEPPRVQKASLDLVGLREALLRLEAPEAYGRLVGWSSVSASPQRDDHDDAAIVSGPRRGQGTGVVVCGSLAAVAAKLGTSSFQASVLVAMARQAAVRELKNDPSRSVASVMHLARDLEIVVFCDPDLRACLWIDVNPVTQQPSAVLLITVGTALGRPEFRCYRS